MAASMKNAQIEDFGTLGTVSPQDRLKQYREDDKHLPPAKRARFWLELRENDPEVAKLIALEPVGRRRR